MYSAVALVLREPRLKISWFILNIFFVSVVLISNIFTFLWNQCQTLNVYFYFLNLSLFWNHRSSVKYWSQTRPIKHDEEDNGVKELHVVTCLWSSCPRHRKLQQNRLAETEGKLQVSWKKAMDECHSVQNIHFYKTFTWKYESEWSKSKRATMSL